MPTIPSPKRVIAFIDGQNLFHGAKKAFGYSYPNYDIKKLCAALAHEQQDWTVMQERFYTGVPDPLKDPKLNQFWTAKLAAMGRANIHTFTRPLNYGTETVTMSDGSTQILTTKQEKGIDVRLALPKSVRDFTLSLQKKLALLTNHGFRSMPAKKHLQK